MRHKLRISQEPVDPANAWQIYGPGYRYPLNTSHGFRLDLRWLLGSYLVIWAGCGVAWSYVRRTRTRPVVTVTSSGAPGLPIRAAGKDAGFAKPS